MSRVRILICGLTAILVSAVLCTFPVRISAADALDDLREKITSVTTLRASFTQETVIPMFSNPMRSEGRLVFKRPDSLRWEYTSPMSEGFTLKGNAGIRWEEDGGAHTPFTAKTDPVASIIARQIMDWIIFDIANINREYDIKVIEKVPLTLQMTPLRDDMRSVIASIVITFSADGPASLVEIQEARGGRTAIVFSDTTVNGPVDDREFYRR